MKKLLFISICGFLLIGCNEENIQTPEENWDESATFVREAIVTEDGREGEIVFRIGDNGKLGFYEYGPFIASEKQKYMWHFWGDDDTLTKPFRVIGISEETGKELTVIPTGSSMPNTSPHHGADHHIPSSIKLPNSGLWKLEAYFGDELFGSVVVNVEDK
ncbi:hypothetical protein [Aquisalibacillus elongatus]|uniref:DUF4871 domain-containing protein n=1 Tax=Aquisalibacillus elongatus TaxID=485577 RepID=A0A3N5AZM9_9BACI|nr:hypothetical protein [Aquisalibacillus elongatus]RPF50389.1 hypothetical protein EDC24_2827 [Aquisalibacillus elongatus]